MTTPAHSAAPLIGKQGPSFYRYKIGDFEVTALNEGMVRNATPANMAVNKSLPEIQKALGDAFLPTDHAFNQFNIIVVNTGKNLVLLDAGFGDNGAPTVGSLMSNMAAAGIDPKNIDTVLISHFHGDTSPVCVPKQAPRTIPTPRSWSRRRNGSSGTMPARRRTSYRRSSRVSPT